MKFRKRPVTIEAVQWNGHNRDELMFTLGMRGEDICATNPLGQTLFIRTLEGEMQAIPGDWIIKGIAGEFYPCKPDIFTETYEAVDEEVH